MIYIDVYKFIEKSGKAMHKKQEGTYSFADNAFRSKMHDLGDALRRE